MLVGLTSIAWREAWKYGERAFRYCQHDAGHAIAALRIAAAMLGWCARVVPALPSADLAALLGVDRDSDFGEAEREEPECLLLVTPGGGDGMDVPGALAGLCARAGLWQGSANVLSTSRVVWDAIDEVAAATRIVDVAADAREARRGVAPPVTTDTAEPPARAVSAASLVLQRRSAVAMSGRGELGAAAFFAMLRRLLPVGRPPFDALWWTPRIHLVCFVHRVAGVEPGLYVLARAPEAVPRLQQAFRDEFAWVRTGPDLPFYLLVPMDARQAAGQVSCGQAIAADGYFSVGMLAEFDAGLGAHGASFYRDLFRETGVIGQVLYLEAEAAGTRGTGIGCFFDDSVHAVLGIRDHQLQSLYHFTVGEPVEDTRLQTRPGYAWG
jgi:nitroreductase